MVYKLEIDGWRSGITFSACHMMPELDKCSRLHGHTYAVHARIYSETIRKGIVIDFTVIKKILRKIIDKLDHKVLLPKAMVKIENKKVKITEDKKEYSFPIEDVILLDLEPVSAENLANYLLERLIDELDLKDRKFCKLELGLDEGWGQGVWLIKKL
ncbi:MAG: 6-carboxytetrahydropterin synthase [Candidatus Thermoplasmatota archaeon]|nr:6-carboxytetrahydropterin synthase [Candidatus Thermoplasmatota archaeon]